MAAGRQWEMVSEEVNPGGGKTSLSIGPQFSAAAPDLGYSQLGWHLPAEVTLDTSSKSSISDIK